MASWKNATAAEPTTRGVLRPVETVETAELRRDTDVHPALAPFVERYWSVRWDLTGRPPFRSEVLSHPSVNVSVESGDRPRFGFALTTPCTRTAGSAKPNRGRSPDSTDTFTLGWLSTSERNGGRPVRSQRTDQ